jgi:lysine-N-methylase
MPRNAVRKLQPTRELSPGLLAPPPGPLPWLPPLVPPPYLPPAETPPRDYIRPNYADRFRCISSACEDTCCQGWSVPVDQGTYEKYRSNETMKSHLGTLIVLNTSQPSTSDYARIPLTGQTCSFLDTDHLCGIQKQLGSEMLSVTCATYPRAITTNTGQREEALNLSCPEAARLTLLDAGLLDANLLNPARRSGGSSIASPFARYAAIRHQPAKHAIQPRLAIRDFILILLAERAYPLWQRLYLLGTLTTRLHAASAGTPVAAWADANPHKVAVLLADSARGAVNGRLRPIMDEIRPQPDRQLKLLIEMLRQRFSTPPIPSRFIECIQDFEVGIGSKTAQNEPELLNAYEEGYRRYYRPLMDENPHLLENYCINYVFKNSYPFGRQTQRTLLSPDAPESEHILLCVHIALVQTLLIGMAAHYREAFGTTHVVKLVQSLARTIEHSQQSIDQIKHFAATRNLTNPHTLALLLRLPD